MSLANFFSRTSVAVSQILQGYDETIFRSQLENFWIDVTFDDSVATCPEAATTVELTVNLLSRLYSKVCLSPSGEKARAKAESLSQLALSINPEIEIASNIETPSFCICIGDTLPAFKCPIVFLGSDGWIAKISTKEPVGSQSTDNPFGAAAAACFGAANAFRFLFAQQLSKADLDSHFQVSLLDWDVSNSAPPNPLLGKASIGSAHLVGLGAVGNAALWVLSRTRTIEGTLHLVDKEIVTLSNLQRYVLTTQKDENAPKVALGERFLRQSGIRPVMHQNSWGEYLAARNDWNLERVAVAVDSAEVRRDIQAALPRSIINAWTQPGDLGVSRHAFLGDQACLMCLYLPEHITRHESELVSEAIGISDSHAEIRSMLYLDTPLSREFLIRVAEAKGITYELLAQFEGRPLRALYVEGVCGGAVLGLSHGLKRQNMEVPMNFQSALAGVMLAAELVIDSANIRPQPMPATTKIDLLKPIGTDLSLPAPKHASGKCICQDQDYISAYREKYKM